MDGLRVQAVLEDVDVPQRILPIVEAHDFALRGHEQLIRVAAELKMLRYET